MVTMRTTKGELNWSIKQCCVTIEISQCTIVLSFVAVTSIDVTTSLIQWMTPEGPSWDNIDASYRLPELAAVGMQVHEYEYECSPNIDHSNFKVQLNSDALTDDHSFGAQFHMRYVCHSFSQFAKIW